MSGLINAMAQLTEIFNKYAAKEGDSKTLTKSELSELLRNEMPCDRATCKTECDKFFQLLDCDGDGAVDFKEYVSFVAALTVILNE